MNRHFDYYKQKINRTRKYTFIICFFLCACQHSFCSDSLTTKVDSIFHHHLESLKEVATDTPDRKYTEDNFDFLYTLAYFDSNVRFNVDNYSLQPMITKKDIDDIDNWYKNNRERINNAI